MLEPDARHPLLDALRPPLGFTLDRAVGTTYTLDLNALMTAPLAFALFDRVQIAEGELEVDPIALLEAVRRHADRIDIFCQAGEIAAMTGFRPLLAYLEASVHAAVPPKRDAIFHPKVWVLRFRAADSGEARYRFLCLSRNLTFDRSWDTTLVLDGVPGEPLSDNRPLVEFVRSLPGLAIDPLPEDRVAATVGLAEELASVRFEMPAGFHELHFWPMGHDAVERWPFAARNDRLLVISPFLTAPTLSRLRSRRTLGTLVSRAETLEHLGSAAVAGWGEVLVLNPDASPEGVSDEDPAQPPAGEGARPAGVGGSYLHGLHAKLYLADAGRNAHLWTGSANATDAAFGGNVEFLVQLTGKRQAIGLDATLAERAGQPTLRAILEPYVAASSDPVPLTTEEELERDLDAARRVLGSAQWVARAVSVAEDAYSVTLSASGPPFPSPPSPRTWCWPIATPAARSPLQLTAGNGSVNFPAVSWESLSAFWVVEVEAERGNLRRAVRFVVNARLEGAPADRAERILATMLSNREDLLRFLLMLLGSAGLQGLLATGEQGAGGAWQSFGLASGALLEPLVKSLVHDPTRLDEIARLVTELRKTDAGRAALPDGWAQVWDPIWAARQELAP